MSVVVETLLIEIEASKATITLAQVDQGLDRMGASAVSAEGRLGALSQGASGLGSTLAGLDRSLTSQIQQFALYAAGALSISAAFSQLRSTISVFSEFEYSMAGVKAITRATAQEFKALKDAALDLSQSTKFTAQEVAEAEAALARGGFSANQALSALPATLALAHVGQLDLAQSAKITSAVLHEFGLSAKQAGVVADALAVGSTSAGQTVEELGNSLKYVGPIASAMGKDIFETAGVLETLGRNGLTSTLSGRALRGMLAGLAAETPLTRKALKELGLTFEQLNPETHSFVEIFGKLHGAGMSASQAVALFRREGFTAATVLAANVVQLKEFTEAQRKAGGEAQRMSGIWNDTTKISLKNMLSSLDLLKVEFGEGLENSLRSAAGSFQSFFNDSKSGARSWGEEFGSLLTPVAEALLFVAKNVDFLKASIEAWLLVKAIGWLDSILVSLGRGILAFAGFTSATEISTVATIANTAAVARASSVYIQYGTVLATTSTLSREQAAAMGLSTAATTAAKEESSKFVGAGLTPMAIGLGVVAGAILYANENLKELTRTYQDSIEKIVAASDKMTQKVVDIHSEITELTDKSVREAAAAKEMLAEGVLPDSTRGQEITRSTELAYRRKQAEAISDVAKRLTEAQSAEGKFQLELAGEKKQYESIEAVKDFARAAADRATSDADVIRKSSEYERVSKGLEGVQARIDATTAKLNGARSEVAALKAGADKLNDTIKQMPTGGTPVPKAVIPQPVAVKVTRQMRLDQLTEDARNASAGLEAVAAAYDKSRQAGDNANQGLQVENKLRQVNREFLGLNVSELDRWIKKQQEDEQRVKGSQTMAALREQREGVVALIAAWGSGEEAATGQARANQLLAQQTQAAASAAEDQKKGIKDTVQELADLQSRADSLARSNDLKIMSQQLSAMAAAALISVQATKEEAAAQEVANAIRQQTAGLIGQERQEIEAKVRAQQQETAVISARQRLTSLREEVDAQASVAQARQVGLISEEAAAEITRQANVDRQVKIGLMEVEIDRAKALAAIPPPNPLDVSSLNAWDAAVAGVNKDFDGIASKTETAIRLQGDYNRELTDGEKAAKSVFDTLDSSVKDVITQALETGSPKWEDIWHSLTDNLLKIFIDMLDQMVRKWIAAQASMAATDYASKSGGGGGGSSLSGLGSIFGGGAGGGGTAGGVTGNTWSTTTVTGYGGGTSTTGAGAAAAIGAELLIFAAIYFGVKSWIDHHKKEMEQFRIAGNGAGGLGWTLGSADAGIAHLGSAADEMIKIVSGVVRTFGVMINGWSGDLTVSRSGHGKHTDYWVQYANGMIQHFANDAQAAFDFATVQALRQSDLHGLPPEVVAAIKNSTANKMEDLQKQIDQAYMDVANRLGNTGSQVYEIFKKYANSISDAITKGLAELQAKINWVPGSSGSGQGGGGLTPTGPGGANAKALPVKELTEADQADLQALTNLIAARNREVDAIRDQLTGVNNSSANRLADIVSFNAGIAEARNLEQSQIDFVQQQLAALGDKSGEAADHLREVLKGYLAELQKIPEAITGVQLDMSIFDVLYQYLQGSQKYEKQRVEYARIKVDLEFQSIKLQLVALGMWDKYAQMWQDAYAAAMQDAGKPAGGKGGGQRKSDEKQLQDLFHEHALIGASDYAHQLDAINKKWNDAIPLAHGNADLLAKIAKARQEEVAALRQQAALKLQDDLSKWEKNARGNGNPWNTQLSDVNTQGADLRKEYLQTAKDLGWSSDRIAQGLAKIDAATLEHARAVDDAAIASLNLPLESTKKQVVDLRNTLDFLRDSVSRGTLSMARFGEIVAQTAQQSEIQILGLMQSIFSTMGATQQGADIQAQAAEANFLIQVAQVNILYNALSALGDAGLALQVKLKPFLDYINDPAHYPDFAAIAAGSTTGGGSSAGSAEQDAASAKDSISRQVLTWLESGLKDQLKSALDLKQAYDQTVQSALKYGYSIQAINDAWNTQVDSFVNHSLDAWEHLGESDLDGQLRQINSQYLDLVNAFHELGASAADMARLEAAHQNALNDFWSKATSDAKKLLDSILHSAPSIPTRDQYESLHARFEDALRRAKAGDLGAISEATNLGSQLEQISQSLFGTASGKFQAILDEIAAGMQAIISMGPPTDIPTQQLQEAASQTDLLAKILQVLQSQGAQGVGGSGGSGGPGGVPANYIMAYGPNGAVTMVPPGSHLGTGWSFTPPGTIHPPIVLTGPPVPSPPTIPPIPVIPFPPSSMRASSSNGFVGPSESLGSMPPWFNVAMDRIVAPIELITASRHNGSAEPQIMFTGRNILKGVEENPPTVNLPDGRPNLESQVDELTVRLEREQGRMDKVVEELENMTAFLGRLTVSLETALKRMGSVRAGERQSGVQ